METMRAEAVISCVFCRIVRGELTPEVIAFRDNQTAVFPSRHQQPRNRGHMLVVPTRHMAQIYEIGGDLAGPLMTTLARAMGDRRGEAFALNNMGSTYSNLGKMEQALEHHEQALEIFREIGDRRSQGDCLTNLGFIYMSRHDTEQALEYCEQAIAIDREVGDMLGLALDSFNVANLLAQQNRFHEALSYAEESASILEEVGHTGRAPQAHQLVAMIRAELDPQTSEAADFATAGPTDLSQQILKVRQDNPELSANMSDEEIIILL